MTITQVDFKILFDNVPGLYLILSPALEIIEVNEAYLQATMTKRDEIMGKHLFVVFPDNPDDANADGVSNLRASLNHVLMFREEHKMSIQKYDIRRRDGTFEERYWSPVNRPVLNGNKEVQYIIHRVLDVTEFVQIEKNSRAKEQLNEQLTMRTKEMEMEIFRSAEEIKKINAELERKVLERTNALTLSEAKFRHALDSMMEGIQIIGFDWKYLYINDAVALQGRKTKEDLLNNTMMESYPGIEQSEMFKRLELCMSKRVPQHFENEFVFADGSVGYFELSIQPVPEGIFILSIDITPRRIAETEVLELNNNLEKRIMQRTEQLQELNSELDAFTYSVSHDLRAPLRAVDGYAGILEEDYNSLFDSEGKRILKTIQQSAQKMGFLIDDLLAFSKLGKKDVQRSRVNMKELFENVIQELSKSNQQNAVFQISNLHEVHADYTLISQVVINLISNAIKYSSKKEKPLIKVWSEINENEVVYCVKDNGVGFDMAYVDKLFRVFQRLHKMNEFDGTGVGLAIVHRIITKHGGRVWAKGILNEGAEFWFALPVIKLTPHE
jgi:PAS domain S-box-containing protein